MLKIDISTKHNSLQSEQISNVFFVFRNDFDNIYSGLNSILNRD